MATWRKGKAVLVTRHELIEPRTAVADHHHHVHHTEKTELIPHRQGPDRKRFFNRRAELLQYSQRLRESAKLSVFKSPSPLPSSSRTRLKPQSLDARRKSGIPTCLGNCKMTFPNFFKLLKLRLGKESSKKNKKHRGDTGNKIKSVMKVLQKQRGFFSKLFLTSRKNRLAYRNYEGDHLVPYLWP